MIAVKKSEYNLACFASNIVISNRDYHLPCAPHLPPIIRHRSDNNNKEANVCESIDMWNGIHFSGRRSPILQNPYHNICNITVMQPSDEQTDNRFSDIRRPNKKTTYLLQRQHF